MRRNKVCKMMVLLLLLAPISLLAQKLTLAGPFGEGAVLQQKAVINIWGTGEPYKEVTGEIQGKQFRAKSNKTGHWEATLSGLEAGGPYQLKVNSGNTQVIRNEMYVGEVWIAAGQSNMAWTLEQSHQGKEHIKNAANPNIRFVIVPYKEYDGKETKDMVWKTATTENVGPMSGIAYFFAKDLQEKLKVPVGIICCYKGGTAAEVWMDRKVLLSNPDHAPIVTYYDKYVKDMGLEKYIQLYNEYTGELQRYQDAVKGGNSNAVRPDEPMGEFNYKRPYGLYNTMLKRIIPYTSKGVIWYQGEANAPRSEQYQTLFPALINEWRTEFKNPEMPFLFVQLANYDHPKYDGPVWPELREAQLKTWQTVKNTAMVVTMDVGEKDDIHPIYKEPVGKRMAACALNTVYHVDVPYSGPIYKNAEIRENQVILSFDYIYSGLDSDGELKGFTICPADGKFVPAQAKIEGDKVIVWADNVKDPVAVRYGWDNWSEGNLKNKEGFPASPFRTDNFTLLTKGVKHTKY